MNKVTLPVALLALATCFNTTAMADSAAQQRFRDQGQALDLSGYLQGKNDAQSRSFTFGSAHVHDFTVKDAGIYRFESEAAPGFADSYRIEAMLMDAQGQVIARGEGNGNTGGLKLEQRLEPGDYVLQVQANRFGTRGKPGDSYSVSVAGLDAQGKEVDGAVSDGEGLQFVGSDREGNTNAFVHGGAVATLGAGSAAAVSAAGAVTAMDEGSATEASSVDSKKPQQVQSIATDVKIRARGEVLTFDVAEHSQVAITTSTYPGGDEDTYRLTLEVVDESGRVVANGAGKPGNGNVDIHTQLPQGRYTINASGQKFGSSHSGPNNYELKVTLDQEAVALAR